MKIVIAQECSGIIRDAFIARGHDAISIDLQATECLGPHLKMDARQYDYRGTDLVIAHPDCTYLANSGVQHFYHRGKNPAIAYCEERWAELDRACEHFRFYLNLPVSRIVIENPIPHRYAVARIGCRYSQIIRPWQFGHEELKATCLWLKRISPLRETLNVGPPPEITTNPARYWQWAKVHRESPGKDRAKNRSRTLPGIASAMAEQWG